MAVAGCSAAIPDSQSPSSAPPPPTSALPSTGPATGLAAIEACDLLTAEEAISLGVPAQGVPDDFVGLRGCNWNPPDTGLISTTINDDLGIDGLNLADASSVSDITIGRHQAKRILEGSGPGYCDVTFAVGDGANVSVLAQYENDTPRACAAADQAAAFVEPKLP